MNHEYRNGDYFECWYTDEYRKTLFEHKHCFEGLVGTIVEDGKVIFYDTFWDIFYRDRYAKIFTPEDIDVKIHLKFIANLDDLVPGVDGDCDYYDSKDLVQLHNQHRCTKSCIHHYRRKGAKRSITKIKESLSNKIGRLDYEIERAQYEKNRLNILLDNVTESDLENIWI